MIGAEQVLWKRCVDAFNVPYMSAVIMLCSGDERKRRVGPSVGTVRSGPYCRISS